MPEKKFWIRYCVSTKAEEVPIRYVMGKLCGGGDLCLWSYKMDKIWTCKTGGDRECWWASLFPNHCLGVTFLAV